MRPRTALLARAVSSYTLAVALLAGPAASRAEPHPTDRCVSQKLVAAATACQQVFQATAMQHFLPQDRGARWLLRAAERQVARAWRRSEARSSALGADCSETTVGAEEMSELLESRAEELVAGLAGALESEGRRGARCGWDLVRKAAGSCRSLLLTHGRHVLQRFEDPDRVRDVEEAGLGVDFSARHACVDEGVVAELQEGTDQLVHDVVFATTVSPQVSSEWTLITPDDEVEYRGQSLAPICSRGTPYVFFAKRGTVNNLIVIYQGGGACWDYLTCQVLPVFKESTGPDDNPAGFPRGFADSANPDNPFRDWNAVFVPYCTGDVHWGDETYTHELGTEQVVIEHKGYVNAQVVEKWTREHFVKPERVFVTGSSAGAYGALMNSLTLQEFVYPSTDFSVLADAGNGVITDEFLENDISKWGIEKNLPEWIPGLNVPITELDAADLVVESALFYPRNRFANYTAAFDGGTGGQTGFYNIMLHPNLSDVFSQWLRSWDASCEWNQVMREQALDAATRAANYRYYIGAGSAHTMFGNDKVYTDTTGNVPTIRDWVVEMIDDGPAWVNVECEECGVVLPGDPVPSPVEPPFTADGRIVCE